MKLIKPSFEILSADFAGALKLIEVAGRVCYKSEDKITPDSAGPFAAKICQIYKHESVIEHASASVRFIVDRGVSHEIVRHRLASYSQESTRYVDYAKGGEEAHCTFIIPPWLDSRIPEGIMTRESLQTFLADFLTDDFTDALLELGYTDALASLDASSNWLTAMIAAEWHYTNLRRAGKWSPQQARSVLPNSTKTEIVMTCNFREWRHFFRMRTADAAHPQMKEVAIPLAEAFAKACPELFVDILPNRPYPWNQTKA